MRRFLPLICMGLGLATLSPAWPCAPGPTPPCGDYGTSVEFADNPKEAAKLAEKDQKLVFVLHVSGHFEDPGIT